MEENRPVFTKTEKWLEITIRIPAVASSTIILMTMHR
jgi:hypothetical protein